MNSAIFLDEESAMCVQGLCGTCGHLDMCTCGHVDMRMHQ